MRGFIMGVVMMALLALSLAGATAVLLSSSEIDMVGSLKRRRQLEACAQSGVEVAAANIPLTGNTPTSWAIDPNRAPSGQLYAAKFEHVDAASIIGGTGGFTSPLQPLKPDAAIDILMAAQVGGSTANQYPSGLQAASGIPSGAATQTLQVFRLLSTCQQNPTGGRLESEGVYVYNPK